MEMPLHPSWTDIACRLALTVIASGAIGLNRGARGHAAGFRTTILVGLAASVAMIQTNILLSVVGKTPDSFGVMDLMRLPLGILTGVGFIGGGTILKNGGLVRGVTTAATLWAVTVIGLCLGGGQLALGLTATALSMFTLWALKWIDYQIPREHRGSLELMIDSTLSEPPHLDALIATAGYRAQFRQMNNNHQSQSCLVRFDVSWTKSDHHSSPIDLLQILSQQYKIESFELVSEAIDHE